MKLAEKIIIVKNKKRKEEMKINKKGNENIVKKQLFKKIKIRKTII